MTLTGFDRVAIAGVTSGMAATFIGVGMARFAYTAILPELIQQGWFSESEAAYLGAANLIGYALGALLAVPLARRLGMAGTVLGCGLLVVLSFLVCAWPIAFGPYLAARLVSGFCGAALMVLVPSSGLTALPPSQRAKGASMIFTGVGLGILISATVVPLLAIEGLTYAWLALAASGALALGVLRFNFVTLLGAPPSRPPSHGMNEPTAPSRWLIASIAAAYAMDAVGFVPHTLFWVDYLQRHLGSSVGASAAQWGLFGIGAMSGPFLIARLGHYFSWHNLLVGGLVIKGIAVLMPLASTSVVSLTLSSVLVGALVPGMVAIVSGRMGELASPASHACLWGLATATFACAQGLSATVFAWMYDNVEGGANLIFMVGGCALLGGALTAESIHRNHISRSMSIPGSVPVQRRDAPHFTDNTCRNGGKK